MRDEDRLKEKIELKLDRRQVTSVSVVALLLATGIFALGVMVGKNLTSSQKSAAADEALLDRLDAAVAKDSGSSEGLTFQDELTKKLQKLPPLPVPAKPKPALAPPATVAATPVTKEPEPSALPAPAPAKVQSAQAGATPDAGAKPFALRSPRPDVDSGVEVAISPKVMLPPPIKPFFTVQVKATQSSGEADSYAKRLRGQGYQALVAEAEVPGKGHWYRVRVGKFENRPQAEKYLADFKRETRIEAFVTAAGH